MKWRIIYPRDAKEDEINKSDWFVCVAKVIFVWASSYCFTDGWGLSRWAHVFCCATIIINIGLQTAMKTMAWQSHYTHPVYPVLRAKWDNYAKETHIKQLDLFSTHSGLARACSISPSAIEPGNLIKPLLTLHQSLSWLVVSRIYPSRALESPVSCWSFKKKYLKFCQDWRNFDQILCLLQISYHRGWQICFREL